jgi:diguanylate cyclase (GGDEF)-like protein
MSESMLAPRQPAAAELDERLAPPHTSSRLEQQVRALTEHVVQLKGELAHALARVVALTTTDHPTGLLTWRGFAERAHAEIARATRYQREIGLVLFALTEPGAGSPSGGALTLRELAEICRSKHRDCDLAGQTEHGEIVVLLPETSVEGALVIGERIRTHAAKGHSAAPRVGCACWPQHGRTLTELLSAARSALSGS